VWRDARLYMIYLSNEMEPEIRRLIASDPALCSAVEMRGRIPHEAVADFLNSADFLLQPSLSEIGCYSVLEAMSCGVIPVVTNIPVFHAMTGEGHHGIVFPVGDHRAMAQRVLQFDLADLETWARDIRNFFERFLSYDAIARIYEAALTPRAWESAPKH
jgi:glycosyltransferase involved in cell wall biosynthesis